MKPRHPLPVTAHRRRFCGLSAPSTMSVGWLLCACRLAVDFIRIASIIGATKLVGTTGRLYWLVGIGVGIGERFAGSGVSHGSSEHGLHSLMPRVGSAKPVQLAREETAASGAPEAAVVGNEISRP
jgi:hypothetical protein